MRNWKSTKSPDASPSVWKFERSFVGNDQVDAAPTKNPFGARYVSPTVAALKLRSVEMVGARDPSTAINGAVSVTVSLDAFSPLNSVVRWSGPRLGKPAPIPHRNAFDSSTPSGLPRNAPPA